MLQENQQPPFEKKKFTQKPLGVIILLWLFFPIGIYFMWKEKIWSSKTRIIITSVFSLLIIIGIAGKNNNTSSKVDNTVKSNESPFNNIAGFYSGTSQMGYSTGTASIRINTDGNADLTYDQGSYGGTTEYGYLEKDGYESYKFHSTSGGGIYALRKTIYGVVLEGTNWRCEMNKK